MCWKRLLDVNTSMYPDEVVTPRLSFARGLNTAFKQKPPQLLGICLEQSQHAEQKQFSPSHRTNVQMACPATKFAKWPKNIFLLSARQLAADSARLAGVGTTKTGKRVAAQ